MCVCFNERTVDRCCKKHTFFGFIYEGVFIKTLRFSISAHLHTAANSAVGIVLLAPPRQTGRQSSSILDVCCCCYFFGCSSSPTRPRTGAYTQPRRSHGQYVPVSSLVSSGLPNAGVQFVYASSVIQCAK